MTKPDKNPLEWTVFVIGLVLVIATLGYLVQESITARPGPPDVIARLGAVVPSANGYLVPVEVSQRGQRHRGGRLGPDLSRPRERQAGGGRADHRVPAARVTPQRVDQLSQ